MKPRKVATTAILTIVTEILSGCSWGGGSVNEEMTVDEAKSSTQAVELRIAGAVPPVIVESISQKQRGLFLRCGDGGHSWAGSLQVQIMGDPEPSAVLDPIVAEFLADASFVSRERLDQGDHIVDIMGQAGAIWVVRYERAESLLVVHSGSECFRLPDDIWSGDRY